jgi:hypothetical protein
MCLYGDFLGGVLSGYELVKSYGVRRDVWKLGGERSCLGILYCNPPCRVADLVCGLFGFIGDNGRCFWIC